MSQALPLLENAVYRLSDHTFLQVAGPDASRFLQGQLSCDVQAITPEQSSIGSHNTPQGRMRCSFRILHNGENSYLLRLHHSIAESALAGFGKYIVFSKAKATQAANYTGIGLHGKNATTVITNLLGRAPDSDYQQLTKEQCLVICTSAAIPAYEIYLPTEKADELWQQLSTPLPVADARQHRLVEHQLGLAFVEKETAEEYLPQLFNYQATPAISFTKGCYTGQEIIARTHYLGKLKKHLRHVTATLQGQITTGESIHAGENNKSVGNVISAVHISESQIDLLAVVAESANLQERLQLACGTLEKLQEVELPYSL
jgi:folate-binding protein YgfZ